VRILILGGTGMLGNTLLNVLLENPYFDVFTTVRSRALINPRCKNIYFGVDAENTELLISIFNEIKPNLVINCMGAIKQKEIEYSDQSMIYINGIFPHNLYRICKKNDSRLVHISTDCVFSGKVGMYLEDDLSDAQDLYGLSKFLGEIHYPNSLTLRTSIVGHELGTSYGLLEWFLKQNIDTQGYCNAIFSGLTTLELSKIIRDIVIPRSEMTGLFHLSSDPISKYDLLMKFNYIYEKNLTIIRNESIKIDRSLNSNKFKSITSYVSPDWDRLILDLKNFNHQWK